MSGPLSIVIPFFNEEESAQAVVDEVRLAFPAAEIVTVNDGSTDKTKDVLASFSDIVVVTLPENRGQGVAVYEGLMRATGDICAIIDGDGQNDPRDINIALELLKTHDCAWGYRKVRKDSLSRRIAGKVANGFRKAFIGDDGVRDVGCSVRAFKREHIRHLIPFEGMHRFMPSFFRRARLSIAEFPANHRPRTAGTSKYTIAGRALRGIWDIPRVSAIIRS